MAIIADRATWRLASVLTTATAGRRRQPELLGANLGAKLGDDLASPLFQLAVPLAFDLVEEIARPIRETIDLGQCLTKLL